MQILDEESLFLFLFLIIFIVGFSIRGFYERKSPDFKKSITDLKKQVLEYETPMSITLLSLFGIVLLAGFIIYVFYSSSYIWMLLPLFSSLRWIGVIIGICCLPFIAWIHRALGESFSKTLTIQEEHKLITTGPYSRVRHPIYSIHTIWFLSWILVSANLLFVVSWMLWIFYVILRVPQEEKMLIGKFGDEYIEYTNRTGALFPRLRE